MKHRPVSQKCRRRAVFTLLVLLARQNFAQDVAPEPHRTSALIVSPLIGWAHNKNTASGQSDSSTEYGLFAMYATPRFIVNNTAFFTDVNQSEVSGNITSVSLFGDPKARLTWFLGASYVWHEIKVESPDIDITIDEPLGKIGFLWRIPSAHLSLNPYIGYAQEIVHEEGTVPTPGGPVSFNSRDRSDLAIYGISASWRWRMLYANAKYYLSDNLDHNRSEDTLRLWGTVMFSDHLGVLSRFEYTEHSETEDTTLLVGPVFVF